MIIKKVMEIDYAHTLPDYLGFCNQIHGHRAKIIAHFSGDILVHMNDTGMLMDFGVCKSYMQTAVVDVLDHGFAVWKKDINLVVIRGNQEPPFIDSGIRVSTLDFIRSRNSRVLECEMPPTAEYLAYWAIREINNQIVADSMANTITWVKVEWWETPNNVAVCDESAYLEMDRVIRTALGRE